MTKTLLIIDDDTDLTELAVDYFTQAHFIVTSTNFGIEGIELAKSTSPDLVILDIKLADIDGFEICKRIRSFSSMPILVLSAISSKNDSVRILDAGADDFLLKPVSPTVLLAHVNNLLRRSQLSLTSNYIVNDRTEQEKNG